MNTHSQSTQKKIGIVIAILIIIAGIFFLLRRTGAPQAQTVPMTEATSSAATSTINTILNSIKANSSANLSNNQKQQILTSLKSTQSNQTLSSSQKSNLLNELKSQ